MFPDSPDNLNAALFYAKRGWPVFPCHFMTAAGCSCGKDCTSPGKHPMTPDGFKSATTDEAMIRAWWGGCPEANIGIRTGEESGVWVLDLDGEEGIAARGRLEAIQGTLPKTPTARTGGGGQHKYFNWRSACPIRNRTKVEGVPIDVRGEGGYVLVPPSNHASGKLYSWEVSPDDVPVTDAPEWLVSLVYSAKGQPKAGTLDEWVDSMGADLDLATAPGVPEGSRHDRACQLVGAHLGRGENPLTVLKLALAWADRCSPPMDKEEVWRIVSDLWEKDLTKDVEAVTEEAPWPVLDQAALHGLAGDIVRAIEPQTEADLVAILAQLLVFFGNVIGRNAHFIVEATTHYTNLFAVLVGKTSKARKGTSENHVRTLFRAVDPAWDKQRITTGLSSGEGLIHAVRDPSEKKEGIKDKATGTITGYQTVIHDHGVDDKRLLVVEPEFASTLRVAKRDGNILSPQIRLAWDSGNLGLMTKNFPTRATGAHISIIGHITNEELLFSMGEVEGFNGFANRFGWLCVTRSKLLPEGGGDVDLKPFIDRLTNAVDFARSVGRMERDQEASELWDKFYREVAKGHRGMLGAVTSRAEAQVLRLSMIYALLDQSKTIRVEHLRAAIALWQYAEDSARYIFGSSTGNALADKILAIVRAGPVTKKDIHKGTGGHLSAKELDKALAMLKREKLIRSEVVSTPGRPAEWYYPV